MAFYVVIITIFRVGGGSAFELGQSLGLSLGLSLSLCLSLGLSQSLLV